MADSISDTTQWLPRSQGPLIMMITMMLIEMVMMVMMMAKSYNQEYKNQK